MWTEPRPLEERCQAGRPTASARRLGEHASKVLVWRFELTARDAMGCERALHTRIGGDHRPSRIRLAKQVVQRLVEHTCELIGGKRLTGQPPPPAPLGEQEPGEGDGRRTDDGEERRQSHVGLVRGGRAAFRPPRVLDRLLSRCQVRFRWVEKEVEPSGEDRQPGRDHDRAGDHPECSLPFGRRLLRTTNVEACPEQRREDDNRADQIQSQEDRGDRVDGVGARLGRAGAADSISACRDRDQADQNDRSCRQQQHPRKPRQRALRHPMSVPASGARTQTASRSASKTTASTSPRSSPSTWSGRGRSERTSIRSRS